MHPEVIKAVENVWASRRKNYNPGTTWTQMLRDQAAFYVGAMAMAEALGHKDGTGCPPRWVLGIFRNEHIPEMPCKKAKVGRKRS